MIDVYTADTPNGIKITIALEEIGAPYRLIKVDLSAKEQKQPEFLKISPNGRIPAIVDPSGPTGVPLSVFESGAILVYLSEKFGALVPSDAVARIRCLEWTFFQVGGIGPMFGQAASFRGRDEKIPFAIDRFERECERLIGVLDKRLANNAHLAGAEFSIADIAHFGWIDRAEAYTGVNLSEFPHVVRWRGAMRERVGVQRGVAVLESRK